MHRGVSLTQWPTEKVNILLTNNSNICILLRQTNTYSQYFLCFPLQGEQNGYNIPEVISVPNLPLWLSEEGSKELNERYLSDKSLPEHAKRLFCDGYMCMYQTDVMMYR